MELRSNGYCIHSSALRATRVREKTYDVNLVTAEMPEYEPLLDKCLSDHFRNQSVRENLLKLGIVRTQCFMPPISIISSWACCS